MKNTLFIGLGTMGYHMAGHVSTHTNNSLTVYNRTTSKALAWQEEFGGNVLHTLDESVVGFDTIILCLGRDEDVRQLVLGDSTHKGIASYLKEGSIIIDHTTTSYLLATELSASLLEQNITFVDAPVSGGETGAINGALAIMAGGNEYALQEVTSLLECYSHSITHMGHSGYGQLAKMVNQICITGILKGLSEGLLFAETHGLNITTLTHAISGGAAGSWQLSNRLETMHKREFDFGFMLKWMVKDLGYAVARAKENNLTLDTTEEVLASYKSLMSEGHEAKDTSALILDTEKQTK